MQRQLDFHERGETLKIIDERLEAHFGRRGEIYVRLDPVSQLVISLLGGRTRSEVSKAAFIALLRRFGNWQGVRDADLEDVHECISAVTFSEDKAERLQIALRMISNSEGVPDLGALSDLSTVDAERRLEQLPGVGPKVASAILNFSTLRRRSLVMDSHHYRIMRRLGLLSPKATLGQARDLLMAYIPQEWTAEMIEQHHGMVKGLGQTLCGYWERYCELCPLRDLCPTESNPGRPVHSGLPSGNVSHAKLRPDERHHLAGVVTEEDS